MRPRDLHKAEWKGGGNPEDPLNLTSESRTRVCHLRWLLVITNNIHLVPTGCRAQFRVLHAMLRKPKAILIFRERLNNMSNQIHLSTSHYHTTFKNSFPSWLPYFSNVITIFPSFPGSKTGVSYFSLRYYSPKDIYPTPSPNNCSTAVSIKCISSSHSSVLRHYCMPPSSFRTLITAPTSIIEPFLPPIPNMKP